MGLQAEKEGSGKTCKTKPVVPVSRQSPTLLGTAGRVGTCPRVTPSRQRAWGTCPPTPQPSLVHAAPQGRRGGRGGTPWPSGQGSGWQRKTHGLDAASWAHAREDSRSAECSWVSPGPGEGGRSRELGSWLFPGTDTTARSLSVAHHIVLGSYTGRKGKRDERRR